MFSKKEPVLSSSPGEAPSIAVDARLPEHRILTCNGSVPLRVFVIGVNESREHLTVDSLQVDLAAYTHVRAHSIVRTESNGVMLFSQSNLHIPITFPKGSNEAILDNSLWQGLRIPNTLPPSFRTCNIGRTYELITRVEITYRPNKNKVSLEI